MFKNLDHKITKKDCNKIEVIVFKFMIGWKDIAQKSWKFLET